MRHASGDIATLGFKSYIQGREKFQAETLDFVWLDEEPPQDIYSEALTRTNATGGIVYTTFTPLQGMTEVVREFYPRPTSPDRHLTQMVIEDAEHIAPQQRQRIINSYKPHERDARTRGVPQLGSGAVFSVPETSYAIGAFSIPRHWPGLIAIDLGFDHPFGAVMLRFDLDTDIAYATMTHRAEQQTVAQHAMVVKGWGRYPVAWPHDAAQHDRTSGETMAELYRQHGLDMLFEHATFEDGGYGLEASVAGVQDLLETGRLKIFDHLSDLLEEMRLLHRKDGRIVKLRDDLVSALRYGLMMRRFAAVRKDASGGQKAVKRRVPIV